MKKMNCIVWIGICVGQLLYAQAIEIPDPNLRQVLVQELGIDEGVQITKEYLATLVVLNAREKSITDLTGLEYCTGLSDLSLEDNKISDLSPLANLTNLYLLSLGDNRISNLSPLANLTGLSQLYLKRNQISDLSPLANLINLSDLDLYSNRVKDLTPLAKLIWLEYLHLLGNSEITDISPLMGLTSLKRLKLNANEIYNIGFISEMTQLHSLQMSGSKIRDLDPLANLIQLKHLQIGGNRISDLRPLRKLINLESLSLSENRIIDLSPLSNLIHLRSLDLCANRISDISSLDKMTELRELNLCNNRVTDINPLINLIGLNEINLTNNQITDLSPLVENQRLRGRIKIKNNPISKVSAFTHIPALQAKGINVEHNTTAPKGVIINGGNVQNGVKAVDPTTLSSKGIILKFSDKVTQGTVELKANVGEVLKTVAKWGDSQLALTLAEGETFNYQTTYIVTLIGVKGQDGRNLDGNQVTFTTAAKEELVESVTSKPPLPLSHASYTLNLKTGLNMISLPVKPDQVVTSKTLARDLAATVILHLDADSQEFIPFVPEHYEGTNFDIEGGMGIIVNVREDKAHTFTGTIWSNTPVAAPSISSNPVWAFTMLFEGQALEKKQLTVTNLSCGISFSTQLDDNCQMGTASVVDSSQQSVINTGDLIQVKADGQRWRYRVTDEDLANAFAHLTLDADLRVPEQTQLLQNYPNPFNPETWLPFKLAQDSTATAKIYDVTGKQIRIIQLGYVPAGNYVESSKAIYWDGKTEIGEQVSSGTYFYQLQAGVYTDTRKMVILK
tara:strand:- start:39 stop:2408 length:2370 start_codon:yes stop_codon:yes gene_type:complete